MNKGFARFVEYVPRCYETSLVIREILYDLILDLLIILKVGTIIMGETVMEKVETMSFEENFKLVLWYQLFCMLPFSLMAMFWL